MTSQKPFESMIKPGANTLFIADSDFNLRALPLTPFLVSMSGDTNTLLILVSMSGDTRQPPLSYYSSGSEDESPFKRKEHKRADRYLVGDYYIWAYISSTWALSSPVCMIYTLTSTWVLLSYIKGWPQDLCRMGMGKNGRACFLSFKTRFLNN